MISGLVLKYLNGECFVIRRGYETTLPVSSSFCLTVPFRATFKWAIAVHKAVRYMFQHLAKRGEAMGFDVGFMRVIPVLGVVARKLVQQVEGRL